MLYFELKHVREDNESSVCLMSEAIYCCSGF